MAIARVASQQTGVTADNTTSVALAYPVNVTNGNLLVIGSWKWGPATSDAYVVGDISKSAGTATVGTFLMDKANEKTTADSHHIGSVVYSVPVTGTGSCTITVAGAEAGSYLGMSLEEVSGADTTSTRAEATNGATGTSTTPDTGNGTSAAGALFSGALCINGDGATITITEDAAFTLIFEYQGTVSEPGSGIDRIVTTGTTDSASWTLARSLEWSVSLAVYKEAAGGNDETGGASSPGRASGADSNIFNETGASRSPASGRGIDANVFGETGAASSPARASGVDANIFNETGGASSPGIAASIDSTIYNESGAAQASVTASGIDADIFIEAGAGLAPGVVTSTDSVIFEETGSASAPAVASGERITSQTYTKTGGASSPGVAAGADANVFGETGSASTTAQAASMDETLYTETGGASAPGVASGERESGITYTKTGGAASPISASGPDSNIFDEQGRAQSPVSVAGVDSVIYTETGTAESPAVASGARTPAGGGSTTWIPIGIIPEIDYTFELETSTHEIRRKRILKDDEEVAEILALLM